ncbi:hypothetical protein ACOTTU_12950 [Roseobacter sp. EG26]|uniref:hypothetical protein n=1 Tax=Roseobacter sp. EG26 TaxID=3412477 RepID=UPI003CE5772F
MKLLITAALVSLVATPAAAASLVYDFEAEYLNGSADDDSVDTVADLAGALLIGTTLTGTLSIDDTFLSGDASAREYAPASIFFDQIDGSAYEPFTRTRVLNGGTDLVDIFTELDSYPVGALISRVQIFLRDFDGEFAGDTGFPTTIDLDDLELKQIAFLGNVVGEVFARERVNYRLTSISAPTVVPSVPLPAGLPLLGGGMVLMLGLFLRRN